MDSEGSFMENVGVVGLGYVGLPLAMEFTEASATDRYLYVDQAQH